MRTSSRSPVAAWRRRQARSGLRTDIGQLLSSLAGRDICYYKCPGNAGDSLIHSGTLHAFERAGLSWERVAEGDDVAGRILVMGGGGNLTPFYDHVDKALQIFAEADAAQIVMLPHGIRGSDDALRRFRANDIVVCRDQVGYDHVRHVTTTPTVLLAHDMAFHLDAQRLLDDRSLAAEAEPVLRDRLAEYGWSPESIASRSTMVFTRIDSERAPLSPETDIDISHRLIIGETDRESAVAAWCMLECIRRSKLIVTDRLHVAIGSALLGVPCEFLPNSYDKNMAVYDFSLWMFPNIHFGPPRGSAA